MSIKNITAAILELVEDFIKADKRTAIIFESESEPVPDIKDCECIRFRGQEVVINFGIEMSEYCADPEELPVIIFIFSGKELAGFDLPWGQAYGSISGKDEIAQFLKFYQLN